MWTHHASASVHGGSSGSIAKMLDNIILKLVSDFHERVLWGRNPLIYCGWEEAVSKYACRESNL